MTVESASVEDFDTFLTATGYEVTEDREPLLKRSHLLMQALTFIDAAVTDHAATISDAQCYLAYAMSAEGGAFNPAAVAEDKTLTKKGIGRNAIVKEWEVNSGLIGSDPVTLLKRVPMAYGLLMPLISDGTGLANFDVTR